MGEGQYGQNGGCSYLELSLLALELGRFSEGKTRQKRLQTERLNGISSSLEKSESLEFRRVVCIGVFDEDRSRYVGPRSRSISGVIGNCYYLITPLIPVPNDLDHVQSTVLVNRGWVPRNWRDKPLEISHDSQQPADIASLSVQHREQSSWWRFWSRSPKLLRIKSLLLLL